ncbi:hypothetical protein HNR62_001068 [Oceanisphaera litoralis]|uniref:hypothetical protein n=1 Tax=Oceanisphaera litoralis TaxID=225144 RepID=UPI001957D391|nr:hypothetical protein [Oceanisphaera litoralis]MBM7455208.1 hypothetical protein [Oceanisphaera litoralis]
MQPRIQSSFNRRPLPPTAATLARRKDPEQAEREAREAYCEQHVANELAAFAKRPQGDHRQDEMSLWQLFSERQADRDDPLNLPLSRMLVAIATMPPEALDYLRTTNSALADAALLIRPEIEDMLNEEAAGLFDEADRTGNWGDLL